jgi:hypothetical protein
MEISRSKWPAHKPLFLRISATDWHVNGEKDANGEWISWSIEQSEVLLQEAIKRGVNLMDVSSGGNDVGQKITIKPGYQVSLSCPFTFVENCTDAPIRRRFTSLSSSGNRCRVELPFPSRASDSSPLELKRTRSSNPTKPISFVPALLSLPLR